MSWSKFRKMAAQSSLNTSIGAAGSGEIFYRDINAEEENSDLIPGLESGSGAPTKRVPEMENFSKKQETNVRVYTINPKFWLPAWVREFVIKNKTPEILVKEVVARVGKDPHQKTLEEAQIILNELGRDSNNTLVIRKHLSREFLSRISKTRNSHK